MISFIAQAIRHAELYLMANPRVLAGAVLAMLALASLAYGVTDRQESER